MLTEPGPIARTIPLLEMLATVGLEDIQAVERPAMGAPLSSSGVATACVLSPAVRLTDGSVTMTVETTSGRTVSCADPVIPAAVAEICVVPDDKAVTSPAEEMLAMSGADVAHVTGPVAMGAPFWSDPVTVATTVLPVTTDAADSDTLNDVKAGLGRTGPDGELDGVPSPPHAPRSKAAPNR